MPNQILQNREFPDITKSNSIWVRSLGLIPAGTQTLAKGPSQFSEGIAPKYLAKGKGAKVWDVDGNEYLDYNMGIGPIILGYCHAEVDRAIAGQLKNGISFSLMHPLEVELAELMRDCIPNAECVRFSKTGCDVTTAAVRLARAFTGREKILCCGYHGWHDWYISVTNRDSGIPVATSELTKTFTYNEIESVLDRLDSNTACVILEPLVFEQEQNGFLSELHKICTANGTLLIFDEMWTGFRCALGGAQEFLGVRSDLNLFSKAMANGMPISAITGRKDVMDLLEEDVFFFTTFGGETLSLAASIACINFIRENDVLQYIHRLGKQLSDGVTAILSDLSLDYVSINGYPFRTVLNFSPCGTDPFAMKTLVQQELIRRGILWSGFHNLCYSHQQEDIDNLLEAYREILLVLKKVVEEGNIDSHIRGKLIQPVFRPGVQKDS